MTHYYPCDTTYHKWCSPSSFSSTSRISLSYVTCGTNHVLKCKHAGGWEHFNRAPSNNLTPPATKLLNQLPILIPNQLPLVHPKNKIKLHSTQQNDHHGHYLAPIPPRDHSAPVLFKVGRSDLAPRVQLVH